MDEPFTPAKVLKFNKVVLQKGMQRREVCLFHPSTTQIRLRYLTGGRGDWLKGGEVTGYTYH